MATSRAKKRGWIITIIVIVGTAILAINNQDKVKEWLGKVPALGNLIK